MGILKKIEKYIGIIRQGKKIRDRFIILVYFLQLPFKKINSIIFKRKINPRLIGNVTIQNKYGTFFCKDNMTSAWIASTYHEPLMRKYFSLKENGVFVDIGANIGKYSIVLGRQLKKGKVVSIEAERGNFETLKKNIGLNKLENIFPMNVACSNKEGKLTFYIDPYSTGGHSLKPLKENKKVEVDAKKLDSILKILKIKKVDLIKIDVEGAELEVLKGATSTLKKSHPKIIFEAWDNKRLDEIRNFLREFKYKLNKIGDIDYLAE